jgi:hypothetical protein
MLKRIDKYLSQSVDVNRLRTAKTGTPLTDRLAKVTLNGNAIDMDFDVFPAEDHAGNVCGLGYKVRAHIEPENIFNGWDDSDLVRVDEQASMKKYREMVFDALEKEFPGADVEVGPQNPWRTHVITPKGDLHEAGELAEGARQVAGEVWESEEWVVYYDTHDFVSRLCEDKG